MSPGIAPALVSTQHARMQKFDATQWLLEGAHVGDVDLSGQVLATVEAIETIFDRMVLVGATLRRWSLEASRFRACDLSNALLGDSALEGVTFEGCKLVGVDFGGARAMAFEARFEGCSLRLARFGGMSLRDTRFLGCDLRDVDFSGADCRGVAFDDCDLEGALFDGTDLRKADLSDARGVMLVPEQNKIKGARIAPELALRLARQRGFVVV